MIPILYHGDETKFITNGIGRLSSCTRCIVTEERNGIYECEFDMPITGEHFEEIERGKIIACTHDDKHDIQPFVIYGRTVPDLNGTVTFRAHHISYRLSDIVVMPFSAGSAAAALQGIKDNSVNTNPFTFWTDKTATGTFQNEAPRLARNMLGGEDNSILDVFGTGEYEFDKFSVKLYLHRGTDSDVEIRYSKNLISLNQDIDDSETYNAVVPYWTNGEDLVTLPEQMIVFSGAEPQIAELTDHNLIIIRTETNEPIEVAYVNIDAAPMDLSGVFQEKPTVAELRSAAITRFENSYAWIPNENLTVDFVQLWQTEEYKEYSALQRVSLCDTVSVFYPQTGINAVKQKVVKTVYNTLIDRYDSIELGQLQTSLGQAIQTQIMENVPTTSMMEAAITYATDLIRGGLGGYVVMTPGPSGYPQEILIMDTPDVNTAVNVWRFNQGGLGHSSNGYQGPFSDIALTQDGRINASMITAGIINANLIRAGVISDEAGKNSWDLEAGQLITKQGTLGDFTIGPAGLSYDTTSRHVALNNVEMTLTRLVTFSSGNRSVMGVSINDGDIYFVGNVGEAPPDVYSNRFQLGIGQTTSGMQYLRLCNIDNTAYIDMYPSSYSTSQLQMGAPGDGVYVVGNFHVGGTKSRRVKTEDYEDRLLYCYETPTPLFGDIGEGVIDSDGTCYVDIDDIFTETIEKKVEYQVFLQREGEGNCYVAEKAPRYFVVKGTPGMKFAWEIKAKQKDYALTRLERAENSLDEYDMTLENMANIDDYITEQEELLYG